MFQGHIGDSPFEPNDWGNTSHFTSTSTWHSTEIPEASNNVPQRTLTTTNIQEPSSNLTEGTLTRLRVSSHKTFF